MQKLRRRLLGTCVALGALMVGLAVNHTADASIPPTPSGWSLVWSDDFNGAAGTGVNTGNWLYDLGTSYPGGAANWGTGEIETMTNSTQNVYHDGAGNLAIRPIRAANGSWTSGRIETQRTDFQPPSGGKLRIEGRIQMPNVTGAAAQGIWPAFWTLGAPFRGVYTNWPSVGEIDIMENVNGANTVWGTLHCGVAPGGPCNEFNGLGGSRSPCPGSSCQSAFHTYSIEWDRSISPQQLRWYVDGQQYHQVSQNQVDATTWANATNHGYFIILNVAIGGSWPGAPTGSTASGVPMLVDYVAVYSSGGGTTQPPTSNPPTGGGRDAYSTIQAESFNAQSGTQTETCSEGGQDVGWIANGDWLQFNNVNFGTNPARQFSARVASGAAGGVSGLVEVRLDSRSNAPIGSFALGNTGGWQSWRTVPANVSAVTGTHTVFLTFTSGQPADYVNVNWLSFGH
ncbi:carbohydrate-binding protein [Dactylosporangium sp. NPDC005572]|uniref:carbohydrate-binding protein n=1 Tax=Dactylosporangium sp. NPDC005572 TaxID=3156889 RepID=UPI0033BD2F7F